LINVYAMSLVPSIPALESANSGNHIQITKVIPSNLETLITTSVDGFQSTGRSTDLLGLLGLLAQSTAEQTQIDTVLYLARLNGKVASSAGMAVMNGIARLYIDSVLPWAREKGLQRLLMRARLSDAVKMSCNLATSRLSREHRVLLMLSGLDSTSLIRLVAVTALP
jgi:hypothetical protein